jgi:hypothetical protein
MLTRLLRPARSAANERGQVLVIFAFAFVAIIFMLALLFDGARGLVMRRELRNASDAAAVAGANILESIDPSGCSLIVMDPITKRPGDPQFAVMAAVTASVAANLPNYDPALIDVTCPLGNTKVEVRLADESPTFFGQIFGNGPLDVAARSVAINGQDAGNQYSVIVLDNSNLGWHQGRTGCPSFLMSGGPTVIFESSVYIDSTCTAANGGALATNGNATTLQLGEDGPKIRIVGEYKPQALTITPAPVEHANPKADPLKYFDQYSLDPDSPSWCPTKPDDRGCSDTPPGSWDVPIQFTSASSLKVRQTSKYIIGQGQSSSTAILYPGVYKGGIELRNNSIALMYPGVYVLQGGGLQLGAQTSMYAVNDGVNVFPNPWTTYCTEGHCGVMIYNTGDSTGSLAMGPISIAAGATFKVRSYDSGADSLSSILNNANTPGTDCCTGTLYPPHPAYDHMLIWQKKDPSAVSYALDAQPELHLNGGGNVFMSGTIYAPQAKVLMGGTSGGSGGSDVTLTLQFIVWDLELSGNATFEFVYDGNEFVTPPDYGLIE